MSEQRAISRVLIRGRVQGVGFRAWIEHAAARRALDGWARNRRDGAVEAVFAGPDAAVTTAVEACHRGPPGARVDAVDAEEGSPALLRQRRPGERFSVLHTAS